MPCHHNILSYHVITLYYHTMTSYHAITPCYHTMPSHHTIITCHHTILSYLAIIPYYHTMTPYHVIISCHHTHYLLILPAVICYLADKLGHTISLRKTRCMYQGSVDSHATYFWMVICYGAILQLCRTRTDFYWNQIMENKVWVDKQRSLLINFNKTQKYGRKTCL
ncbi:hypothetical protein EGW08_002374 [Elysia chlorotica]|uniref:Uncharacterized protein n=1 Tax=Elysia chlorotica TaxID=188477 RepID=A0A3S0ZYJ1_ELYCH|nr:hypothetical protein EGW08_002374 [Elysia chlorotica]